MTKNFISKNHAITDHQGNANHNHSEISSHLNSNGYYQVENKTW